MQAAISETVGVQETPFLPPHNKSLLHAHIYSNLKRIIIYVVPPPKHTHLWTLTLTAVNRLNNQMQSSVGKVNAPANKS